MELRGFVKRLVVPPGFEVPRELTYEGLRARALSRADLADDVAGINARPHPPDGPSRIVLVATSTVRRGGRSRLG